MSYESNDKLRYAELFDAWRVVPRILMAGYSWLIWDVTQWYTSLIEPTTQQSTFIGVVWGAAAGIFGLYVNSSRRWPD